MILLLQLKTTIEPAASTAWVKRSSASTPMKAMTAAVMVTAQAANTERITQDVCRYSRCMAFSFGVVLSARKLDLPVDTITQVTALDPYLCH